MEPEETFDREMAGKITKGLHKALGNDLDPTDCLMALLPLQKMASDEKSHSNLRNDMIAFEGAALIAECAQAWNCSFRDAMERTVEAAKTRRFPLGEDSLLSMPYSEYLKTPHWRAVRAYALLRADHRCQLCNGDERLEVHHRTYQRKGMEDYRDVVALCHKCHAKFHGKETE